MRLKSGLRPLRLAKSRPNIGLEPLVGMTSKTIYGFDV